MRNLSLYFIFVCLGIISFHESHCQNESLEIVSTASGTIYSPKYSVEWIIGELVVSSSEENNFSQGFLMFTRDRVTGVSKSNPFNVSIYPNPIEDVLYISSEIDKINIIALYDVIGKEVLRISVKEEIDCSFLRPGIYHVIVFSDRGEVMLKKKIIKK